MRWTLIALVLAGCGRQEENPSIHTLEGVRYEWALFNHRVSHIEYRLEGGEALVSVVGGTSTTGVDAQLPPECDPGTCDEIPFFDQAIVKVDWARVDAPEAIAEVVTVSMTADADGEDESVSLTLEGASEVPVGAWIHGLRLSTDHPLDGGEECYDPSFGWLPTELSLEVGDPIVKGDKVTVEVSASFAAGKTLEEIRACLDEVTDRARVALEVDLMVVAGGSEPVTAEVSSEAAWELGTVDAPIPQEPPPPTAIDLGLEDPVLGWKRAHWKFHVGDPDQRGAYLRSLELFADPQGATGNATNLSATQLSGFDYTFSGTVIGQDLGGTVTRGSLETTLDVLLDETTGEPVVFSIGEI